MSIRSQRRPVRHLWLVPDPGTGPELVRAEGPARAVFALVRSWCRKCGATWLAVLRFDACVAACPACSAPAAPAEWLPE